jgi:nucleotide-binding universal stress UspA family protein
MLKLLVPVSHSTRSLQAVRHAAFLYNEGCASEVVLINVLPPLGPTRVEAFYSLATLRANEESYAEATFSRAKRILEDAGVKYSVEVREGPLVPTIADCAEQHDCDEIVVTAPRRDLFHAVARLVHRSVLDRLVSVSRVPVTAVN